VPVEATRPVRGAGPVDRSGLGPDYVYVQIADDLAARMDAGEFPHGRLPGERKLAVEYRVSYLTLRHAMNLLRQRGLIITLQGRGTFATPPGPRPAVN
jgi:DNA-binding GntR family transcriptional regulator